MDTPAAQLRPSRAQTTRLGEHTRHRAAFSCAAASRCRIPIVRRRLLGRDRDPRLRVLGAGVGPQSGGRIRRSDCHRLGRAADTRRLYHQRPRSGQRHAALPSLLSAGDCRCGRRCLRFDRRPAGAAAAHVLFRHHDARLRHHRHPGGAGLAERNRRRRGRSRAGIPGAVLFAVGLLLFLLRSRGDLHLDDGKHRGEPLRPRPHRDPRCRGCGRSQRHLETRLAGVGVSVQRRRRRRRRRTVRLAAVLHHARRVHARPLGAVLHRHPDRRPRLHSRTAARHDSVDRAAGIRRAVGGVVHVSLRGAAARHRASNARRHCGDSGLQEPPPPRQQPRDHSAARTAAAPALRADRCHRRVDAGAGGVALRRRTRSRRPRPRDRVWDRCTD